MLFRWSIITFASCDWWSKRIFSQRLLSRWHFEMFFLFSKKISFDISCILSPRAGLSDILLSNYSICDHWSQRTSKYRLCGILDWEWVSPQWSGGGIGLRKKWYYFSKKTWGLTENASVRQFQWVPQWLESIILTRGLFKEKMVIFLQENIYFTGIKIPVKTDVFLQNEAIPVSTTRLVFAGFWYGYSLE